MSSDRTKAAEGGPNHSNPQAPEAELPQAPPGAPEGHDAVTPGAPIPPPGTIPPVGADVPEPAPAAAVERDPELPPEPARPSAEAEAAVTQPPAADGTPADVAALTAKAQKADEYLALAQRTQADFENYRKRAARDAKAAQERGAIKLALELLPAIDNLERALAHAGDAGDAPNGNGADSLVTGIKHVHSDVVAALQRAGIERYSPEGERFDPQFHEAVAQQPVEGAEPGVVVEVFQRGYRIGDSVVRPARVVVAG
ncbi:MAG TPA: nucleotide exchange factor GrpE [Solirubrobacteraceae bacterium]|nr:nucleotide exchange factor GrpE [Solirubrobacteraceae bacterium]